MSQDEKLEGFAEFFREVGDGAADIDLGAQVQQMLKKLYDEAQDQGQATGEIGVKLKFHQLNNGKLRVDYETSRKEPKPRRESSVFFVNERGQARKSPWKQEKLPFSEESEGRKGKLRGVS